MSPHPSLVRNVLFLAVSTLGSVLLAGGLALPASAQFGGTPVELQETNSSSTGARALGMGKAFVAVSDDVSSFAYNPAGLVQLLRPELAGGLSITDPSRTVTRDQSSVATDPSTRFGYLAVGGAQPAGTGKIGYAFGFRRYADLNENYFSEGYLLTPTPTDPGLFGVDSYQRLGSVNAWSGALAYGFGPVAVGGSISYLTGSSQEYSFNANYRADLVGGDVILDTGIQIPDDAAYQANVSRYADVYGWTGSLGVLVFASPTIRVGGTIEFPASLQYTGNTLDRLEDWEKIDQLDYYFVDDITLPLALQGGAAFQVGKVLLSGEVDWTDYQNIDYAGQILAPGGSGSFQLVPAYRSVVSWYAGAEYAPTRVFTVRGGVFQEPLPYRLILADTDFVFSADDPGTEDDYSIVYRDYPQANILSDGVSFTAGASFLVGGMMTIDGAYAYSGWTRETSPTYQNSTPYYPTEPTTEKFSENQFYLSTTFRLP